MLMTNHIDSKCRDLVVGNFTPTAYYLIVGGTTSYSISLVSAIAAMVPSLTAVVI